MQRHSLGSCSNLKGRVEEAISFRMPLPARFPFLEGPHTPCLALAPEPQQDRQGMAFGTGILECGACMATLWVLD